MASYVENESHSSSINSESDEWRLRVDLAACYRLVYAFGFSDIIYNHISARVTHNEFLINPYGLLYNEITASSLIKIDIEGNEITSSPTGYKVNPAGFIIHGAIHKARPDVACVLHTHSMAGVAVSTTKQGLLPLTQFSMRFHDRIAYHEYEGPALDPDEQQRLVSDLGDKNVMILKNHGLLTAYPTIGEAFNAIYWLEKACRVQLDAMASSSEINIPDVSVAEKTARLYDRDTRRPYGLLEWPAMLRYLDSMDESYKS
jgi:ribulose-5-phosphate 4-epimerase/fuculose-1-phosphate aldolase